MKYETIDSSQIAQIMDGQEPGPPKDWTDGNGGGKSPSGDAVSKGAKKPTASTKPAGQH